MDFITFSGLNLLFIASTINLASVNQGVKAANALGNSLKERSYLGIIRYHSLVFVFECIFHLTIHTVVASNRIHLLAVFIYIQSTSNNNSVDQL